jgi:hypothetical protein
LKYTDLYFYTIYYFIFMKLLRSIVTVFALVTLTVAGTLAVLTDSADVSGVTISAGNADLKIAGFFNLNGPTANGFQDSLDFGGASFLPSVYPGFGVTPSLVPTQALDLYLKNDSLADISLSPSMRLTTLPTGWGNNLSFAVQMLVQDKDSGSTTGWKSLVEWQSGAVDLPGADLAKSTGPTDYRTFYVYTRVPYQYGADQAGYVGGPAAGSDVGNEIQNQQLVNGGFTLTATQV